MARSAQDKFNAYLDECRETNDAINEFVKASYDNNDRTYSYAAGYLQSMIKDVISELPKARRAELRKKFLALAQTQKNEFLIKTLKETENA